MCIEENVYSPEISALTDNLCIDFYADSESQINTLGETITPEIQELTLFLWDSLRNRQIAVKEAFGDVVPRPIFDKDHPDNQFTTHHIARTALGFAVLANIALTNGYLEGYKRDQIKLLTIGALLHDAGKLYKDYDVVFRNITNPGNGACVLGKEEIVARNTHPIKGAEYILAAGLPTLLARMAFEHHMSWNNPEHLSYPCRKGEERNDCIVVMHQASSILAAIDKLEASTSLLRIYNNKKTPEQGCDMITDHIVREVIDPGLQAIFEQYASDYYLPHLSQLSITEVTELLRQYLGFPQDSLQIDADDLVHDINRSQHPEAVASIQKILLTGLAVN